MQLIPDLIERNRFVVPVMPGEGPASTTFLPMTVMRSIRRMPRRRCRSSEPASAVLSGCTA